MVDKCGVCKERLFDASRILKCNKCKKTYCTYCGSNKPRQPGIIEIYCPKMHLIKTKYIDPGSRQEISREKFQEKMGYS